jgi:hypothetical protein
LEKIWRFQLGNHPWVDLAIAAKNPKIDMMVPLNRHCGPVVSTQERAAFHNRVSMKNNHNFMQLEVPNFGAAGGMKTGPALTFCRQRCMALWAFTSPSLTPLRRLARGLSEGLRGFEGRGAGEGLLLPNLWALRPRASLGLLRGRFAVRGVSMGMMQAMTGTEYRGASEAGASLAHHLAGILQAFTRALLCEGGGPSPLQPCMNELPSHAQNITARRLPPDRLCRARGAGVQKLY